ncbi:MAG TPA: hypothetical protein VI978_00505 [Candidatus Paceibacterota bacterium]
MVGNLNLDQIYANDVARKKAKKSQHMELTLRDYIGLVTKDSLIAQNSPSRLLETCLAAGVEEVPERERWLGVKKRYRIFSEKLFGVERPTAQFVSFLETGAARLSTGKQILLFVGPPASGKSSFVKILKGALEDYNTRLVFSIKGCPMHQEPLLLLPRYLRKQFEGELGVKIEGDLCPVCRHLLQEFSDKSTGEVRWLDIPVETFTFSIQGTRGISSFEATDDIASDIAKLVGHENIGVTSNPEKGYDHHLAFTLSGELPKANRGLVEGRELTNAKKEQLAVFFSVAEEKEIKIEGSNFPHISVDEVVIGHTNLASFKEFNTRGPGKEGLHSRFFVIPFPYPTRVKDEVRVYRKLIQQESDFAKLKNIHIAPGTLELAATFAILTRLSQSQTGIDSLTKLKIYNGDKVLTELENKEKVPVDIRHLLEEGQNSEDISKREGMFGVGSRDVLAALNTALVEEAGHNGCLTPLKAIYALRRGFEHRMGYTPEDLDRFKLLLSAGEAKGVPSEYKDFIVKTVSRAFLAAYDDLARELFDKYILEAQFERSQKSKIVKGQIFEVPRDQMSGKPKEPDTKFLRSIESYIPITESEAETFRGEIIVFKSANPNFGYDSYPPLSRAVEKKLLADSKSQLTTVLATDRPKEEGDKRRIDNLFMALTNPPSGREEDRHCKFCAAEAVERAREFLSE